MKLKKVFSCTNCGANSPKWIGNCPSCNEWNTYIEEIVESPTKLDTLKKQFRMQKPQNRPIPLLSVQKIAEKRNTTPDGEFNRTLGGGIVPGSLILIGGQPGIGKSTLMLQIALNIKSKVLYVSGEESEEQIKMRADRIGIKQNNVFVLTETNLPDVIAEITELKPELVIIDSIQTLSMPDIESIQGSVTQVRECTAEIQRFAKSTGIPFILIGHINKEGLIAGPKVLEHIVDVVLQFEGDALHAYRIIRTRKNRFGSTDEIGIYEMQSNGLREISNPSEMLLSQTEENLSGSVVCATLEGMRPLLLEVQALVSTAIYGTAQRSVTTFDLRRLSMLLAVLEKRGGLKFSMYDVFLNIAGGLKIADPALDLAVVVALVSSLQDIPIPKDSVFAGEIGLSGEIRAISRIEQRIQEAERLGFNTIYIPKNNMKAISKSKFKIKVHGHSKVNDVLSEVFG
ncbi:MAG: DNA repair protein RadA [Saprospiraceae bacterium]